MESVFIELARNSGASFRYRGVTVPAVTALQSLEVANELVELGALTVNAVSPGLFDDSELMPTLLMAVCFAYALEVAPRVEGEENVVDVPKLMEHTAFMRKEFGGVKIDPQFVTRLRMKAAAARPAPAPEREAIG